MATEKRESKGKPEIRAVRRGNIRHFYRRRREVASYTIRPDVVYPGEKEAVVYTPQAKMLGISVGVCLGARELKEDEESVRTFLECFLPRNLARVVVEHAKKDLGVG